eukprot:Rhum_TRINITY_DN257_c0_g2::Rhum_TRINITY_DN257_c0_g2_i1::g.906::m.906
MLLSTSRVAAAAAGATAARLPACWAAQQCLRRQARAQGKNSTEIANMHTMSDEQLMRAVANHDVQRQINGKTRVKEYTDMAEVRRDLKRIQTAQLMLDDKKYNRINNTYWCGMAVLLTGLTWIVLGKLKDVRQERDDNVAQLLLQEEELLRTSRRRRRNDNNGTSDAAPAETAA